MMRSVPFSVASEAQQPLLTQSAASVVLLSLAFLLTPPSHADVLRWNGGGQGSSVASGAFVLHYDAAGVLIGPEGPERGEEEGGSPADETDLARLAVAPSAGQGARLAAFLPALRLAATRYADHAALDLAGLTPKDWALLFQALVRIESGFNPEAVSSAGARGLAQLMPDTARALGVAIDDPHENLDGGARYLLTQIETFGSLELALAAYNAGPEAVRKCGGIPPFAETRAYVSRVLAEFDRLRAASHEGTPL